MGIKNRTIKHWVLFLLLFLPVMYLSLSAGPVAELVASAVDSVAGALNFVPVAVAIIGGIGISAALFWFIADRAGQMENQITEEEAYYYYDYPDDK